MSRTSIPISSPMASTSRRRFLITAAGSAVGTAFLAACGGRGPSGGDTATAPLLKRVSMYSGVLHLLLFVAIVDMIWKPGA